MSTWKNIDRANGYGKPVFANTADVYGVSSGEVANSPGSGVAHSGWIKFNLGTGPLAGIYGNQAGAGINSNGYITLSNGAFGGGAESGANVFYEICNVRNTLQPSSANAWWNVISYLVVRSGGANFNVAPNAAVVVGINTVSFTTVLGGRGGRKQSEVLVTLNEMSGDSPTDNTFFPGV
jgi:hypothetical protein